MEPEKIDGRKNNGGAGRGQGQKSREERGLEPLEQIKTEVEISVKKLCKQRHGSYANALRFAATHKCNKSE